MLVTAYLHYVKCTYMPEGEFQLWPCQIDWDKEKMFIKKVELEIPDIDIPTQEEINSYLITGLRKEKEQVLSAAHMKVKAIDEQIQQLLCLTVID